MRKIKKTVVLLVAVCLFISGCSVSSGNKLVKEDKLFKEQNITKDIVISKLGHPESIFQKDGNEVYQYNYSEVSGSIWPLIPVVGFVGMMVFGFDKGVYKSYYSYIFFDKYGNYIEEKKIKLSGSMSSLNETPKPLKKDAKK